MTNDQSVSTSGVSPTDGQGGRVLHVIHETLYTYGGNVEQSHHLAYLQPLSAHGQLLEAHALEIEPPPSRQTSETDVYGNMRCLFQSHLPHDRLRVAARSRVRVVRRFAGLDAKGGPAWEEVAASLRYASDRPFHPESDFVFASPYVPMHAELRDYALASFTARRPLADAALALMHRIHQDFTYASASTDVSTPVLDVFAAKQGVCQDFAHVLIGCLRALGLAARYVSGYLVSLPPPGQPRLIGADASHAWVALHLPGLGMNGDWLELDPTNDMVPEDGHVVLACGRDYGDVTPLRGVIRGAGAQQLQVAVTVAPEDEIAAGFPSVAQAG